MPTATSELSFPSPVSIRSPYLSEAELSYLFSDGGTDGAPATHSAKSDAFSPILSDKLSEFSDVSIGEPFLADSLRSGF